MFYFVFNDEDYVEREWEYNNYYIYGLRVDILLNGRFFMYGYLEDFYGNRDDRVFYYESYGVFVYFKYFEFFFYGILYFEWVSRLLYEDVGLLYRLS